MTLWPTHEEQYKDPPLIPLTEKNLMILHTPSEDVIAYNGVPIHDNKLLVRMESTQHITDARLKVVTVKDDTIVFIEDIDIPIRDMVSNTHAKGIEDPVIMTLTRQGKKETYLSAVHTNFSPTDEFVAGGLSDMMVTYGQVISPVSFSNEGVMQVAASIGFLGEHMKNYWALAEGDAIRHFIRVRKDCPEKTPDGKEIVFSGLYTCTTKEMSELTPELIHDVYTKTQPLCHITGSTWLGLGPILPGGVLIGHSGSFLTHLDATGTRIPWYREYCLTLCLLSKDYTNTSMHRLLVDPQQLPSSVQTKHPSLRVVYPKFIRRVMTNTGEVTWLINVGINDRYQGVIYADRINAPEFCDILATHVDTTQPDFAQFTLELPLAQRMYPQWYT